MLYLYLDESGDLGFDFFSRKPSRYFCVTVLAVRGVESNRRLIQAVKKTIKRKLPAGRYEMKGSKDSVAVREYFYKLVTDIPFELYSITLNKRRVYERLAKQKSRVYNFMSKNVIDKIPIENASTRLQVIIDKSKSRSEIRDFNEYIIGNIQGRLDPQIPLGIYHWSSVENAGLQAVDVFSWGIYRKYEKNDCQWFNIFKDKVTYDSVYLPEK